MKVKYSIVACLVIAVHLFFTCWSENLADSDVKFRFFGTNIKNVYGYLLKLVYLFLTGETSSYLGTGSWVSPH